MNFKFKQKKQEEADVDVTSFMNLMIVLVPVLLMSMTFTQTNVLEIKLPELTGGRGVSTDPQTKLEVEITEAALKVYYPETTLIQEIPATAITDEDGEQVTVYDYQRLSLVLQALKQKVPEKRDILLRSELNINYQHIIAAMDTLKSYKTTLAASVVEVELFPEISLDDARNVGKARKK